MKQDSIKKKIMALVFLAIILVSSIYINTTNDLFGDTLNDQSNNGDIKDEIENNLELTPETSSLGNDSWWDSSYQYRRLINVTNPYSVNFTDFAVNVTFDYTDLVAEGKMQDDLDDIRIVENGILRDYYVVKDYPEDDYATVFFDTNITKNHPELDTYMYFGYQDATNAESDQASDTFGWIKNGNFELDIDTSKNFDPFGWTFSHEPIDMLTDDIVPNNDRYDAGDLFFFENRLLSSPETAERVAEGTYAYKWGARDDKLADINTRDYAGTFYSYPFKVPVVEGGGISIHIYRNIRTWYFEYFKNQLIDKDGYFMRLCNGTTSYSSDPDEHKDLDESGYTSIIEAYGGYAEKKGPNYKKEDQLVKHPHIFTDVVATASYNSSDGGLTGALEFDISNYMGGEVFLEQGTWGNEDGTNDKSAFFQLDDVRFNYTLPTEIHELQKKVSSTIIVPKDKDGRIIPGAKVYLVNSSAVTPGGYVKKTGTTGSDGHVTFTNIPNGYYDIIVNYTLGALTETVFNSTETDGPYYLNGIQYLIEPDVDIWTIDFEIVDYWGIPLNLGHIKVYEESSSSNPLATLMLSSSGTATFRWIEDDGDYYYKVYYVNDDYSDSPILLNYSYILRSDYLNNEKYKSYSDIHVNTTNTLNPSLYQYKVNETIYTERNKRINAFNITLRDMDTKLTDVSIYYLDENNKTGSAYQIYYEDGYGSYDNYDYIPIDIALIDNDQLETDGRAIYGLNIIVNGENNSRCDGVIEINTIETCNIYNKTNLARLNIRVIYINEIDPLGSPTSAFVKIKDNSSDTSLINMTSDKKKDGYTYGSENSIPFWYEIGTVLNFSMDVANYTMVKFNVTKLEPDTDDQYRCETNEGWYWYNYTFYGDENANLTFNIIFETLVNLTTYMTNFTTIYGETRATWGESLSYWVNFTYSKDNGNTWLPVTDPLAKCYLNVIMKLEEGNILVFRLKMTSQGNGNFSITFDTSQISAGLDDPSQDYDFEIEGLHPSYDNPDDAEFSVRVYALPTGINALDQSLNVIVADPPQLNEYYDEMVNITIWFYDLPDVSLEEAIVTYKWIGVMDDYESMDPHPTTKGYYYITLDTGFADAGNYKIYVTAKLENHSIQEEFTIFLEISDRRTTLNDKTLGIVSSPVVWVQDEEIYTFYYEDFEREESIEGANAYYIWWDWVGGNIIENTGGSGDLAENADNSYTIDFNTELRSVGYYFIEVHLEKDNFQPKSAILILEIRLREFDSDLEAENLEDDQVNVVQGKEIEFEIELTDSTRGDIPLIGADVVLEIGDKDYEFDDEGDGKYTLTFKTKDVEAFFTSNTLTGEIVIKVANFTTEEIDITIVVEMEEIYDGMPTFYFIMLVASVAGILGSLISYRVIQQARIPGYVKKLRKVKSIIKANKSISESYSIPTIEKMMFKNFGKDWQKVGISLEEIFGIKKKKPSGSIGADKISKQGGGTD